MDLSALKLSASDGGVRFEVHAKPRAKKSAVVGLHGDALDVALAAAPVDGAANAELIATLARALAVPKSAVTIVRGETSRTKLVAVRGVDVDAARARLAEGGTGAKVTRR